jgi:hypothetical protein
MARPAFWVEGVRQANERRTRIAEVQRLIGKTIDVGISKDDLAAIEEVAGAWASAEWTPVESRTSAVRPVAPVVEAVTPGGRRMDISSYLSAPRRSKISPRIMLVAVDAPRFPEGAGFSTFATVIAKGQPTTIELPPCAAPVPPPLAAPEPQLEPEPEVGSATPDAPRRGRRPVGEVPLTKAERNRRWRHRKNLVTVDLPETLAERIRILRDAADTSTAELISSALDALERDGGYRGNR